MFPPLVSRFVADPSLALEHVKRYVALAEAEVAYAGKFWQRRVIAGVCAAVLFGVGGILGGVALLLAQMPVAPGVAWQPSWLFWAVPLVPLVGAIAASLVAAGAVQPAPFSTLREQLAQDAALLMPSSAADADRHDGDDSAPPTAGPRAPAEAAPSPASSSETPPAGQPHHGQQASAPV